MIRRAMAIAVALACVLASAGCTDDDEPAAASSTTAATRRTTTVPVAGLVQPCRATDLGIDSISQDGASSRVFHYIGLQNVSPTSCSLSGYPTSLTADEIDGGRLTKFVRGVFQPDPEAGNVAPGATGILNLETNALCLNTEGPKPPVRRYKNVHIGLPGGGKLALGDFVVDGTCGLAVSKLGVGSSSSSTEPSPETTTTSVALARPCRAADLSVGGIDTGAATGHVFTNIHVANTSSSTCSLSEFPTSFTAVSPDGTPLREYDRGTFNDPPAGNVETSYSGVVRIETSSVCIEDENHPPRRTYKNIKIGVPGGGSISLGDITIDGTCYVKISNFGTDYS